MLELPEGVHAVRAGKATYYYWHPNRGTEFAGKAIPLGKDAKDPLFWEKLKKAQGDDGTLKAGSFKALVAQYKASKKYLKRRPKTKELYDHQIKRIVAAWGDMPVDGLTVAGIYALRAKFEDTAVSANHLVSVLRTMLKWGLAHGYGKLNPAREIEPLDIEDEENAKPWPEWAYALVLRKSPERVRRAVYLARAAGQRRSDVLKLGKKNRDRDGLLFKVGKLRDKPHFIPMTLEQLAELDSWSCSDTGPWVVAVSGSPMSGDNLQSTLNRFVATIPELQGLTLNMHGLRAMAACDRKLEGAEDRAIGANLCMSVSMVQRYTRNIDNEKLARGVRDKMQAKTVLQFGEKSKVSKG